MLKSQFTAHRYEQKRLQLMAQDVRGKAVLDIGYAKSPNFALLNKGRHITGIDLSKPTNGVVYDEILVADVFDLKYQERQFDTVLAGEFIEHIEEPYALLRLFKQLLKPDGLLILSTPNPLAFPIAFWEWAQSPRRFYTKNHVILIPPRWMLRMLERSGFYSIKSKSVGLWPLTVPCPIGLSYQVIYSASPNPKA